MAIEAKEDEEMEDLAWAPKTVVKTEGVVSQISLVPEERRDEEAEALITVDETESEKKVRHRWNRRKEREGWVMRAWNTSENRVDSFERENFGVRSRRLILYQEICV